MNKKLIVISTVVISLFFIIFNSAFAYDPNNPIAGGRIRNVCGGIRNDPNCLVNTCDEYSGSCFAPSGYSIIVFKCDGAAKRPGTNDYECLSNGASYPTGSTKSVSEFAEACKTVQIDVVDSSGQARDWLVWVSDQQSCGYQPAPQPQQPPLQIVIPQPQQPPPVVIIQPAPQSPVVIVQPSPAPSPAPVTLQPSFSIDVFSVDATSSSVRKNNDITVEAGVKLVDAPSGSHTVTVKWYIDDNLMKTQTISMSRGETSQLTSAFGTSSLSTGSHTVKVRAEVSNAVDSDSDSFQVTSDAPDFRLGDLSVSPSTICQNRDELIEFSIPVTLERGNDDTELLTQFMIEGNDGGLIQIDSMGRILDVGETRTFAGSFNYRANRLFFGTHDVKVVVENAERETEFATLRIVDCPIIPEQSVDVGIISLSPEFPNQGDIALASVPITLKKSSTLPKDVFVSVKIDGNFLTTSYIRFNTLSTRTFQFTINTALIPVGSHTVEVTANAGGVQDTSIRTFAVGPIPSTIPGAPLHCLVIDDIWSDRPLRDNEYFQITGRVRNCGLNAETVSKTTFEGFGYTFSSGSFLLLSGKTKDVAFTIFVPDEFHGETALRFKAVSPFAADDFSKNFIVQSGFPSLKVSPQYNVEECTVTPIQFNAINAGPVRDTFTISVSGDVTDWFTNLPYQITLESKQHKVVEALVNVPCGIQPGLYQFTLSAKGSPDFSVTSSLKVIKPFVAPRINIPAGFVVGLKDLGVWILLTLLVFLLLLALIFLLLKTDLKLPRRGRKIPEKCLGGHAC